MSLRKDKADLELLKLLNYEVLRTETKKEMKGNFIYTKVVETLGNRITGRSVELHYTKDYERIDDDSDKNFLLTTGNY